MGEQQEDDQRAEHHAGDLTHALKQQAPHQHEHEGDAGGQPRIVDASAVEKGQNCRHNRYRKIDSHAPTPSLLPL